MPNDGQIALHVYRAITGGRLSPRTESVDAALRAVGRLDKPWLAVGISRETWRRWNLAPDRKNYQDPTRSRHRHRLLAVLRRLRLSAKREAQVRQGRMTLTLWSNYEQAKRVVGPQTVAWGGTGPLVDAFLRGDPPYVLADKFREQVHDPHFHDWLTAFAGSTSQSYDVIGLDLMTSPERGTATRGR